RRHALLDSSSAHSNNSGGTALIPASSSTPMNELPRHTLNRVTLKKLHAPPPSAPSTACLMCPMNVLYAVEIGGFSVQYHPITLTLAGYPHAREIAMKNSAPPPKGRARESAEPPP